MHAHAPRDGWEHDDEAAPQPQRIVRFPRGREEVDEDPLADAEVARESRPRRARHGRQAAEPDSRTRYALTALVMLATVALLSYLAIQVGQLGKQAPSAPVASNVPPQSPQPAASQTQASTAPGAQAGQGTLRMTSRVIDPSYTVQRGDTLGSIAAKFGTNVEALQSINNLADRNILSVGQKLVIPNQD